MAKVNKQENTWCIRFQTRDGSGRISEINSIVFVGSRCYQTGWGHTDPGHYRHVIARSAIEALRKAFGLTYADARHWLTGGIVQLKE